MLTRKISLQHGAGAASHCFSSGGIAREIGNHPCQFIGIARFNDDSTIILSDKAGNLTVSSSHSNDWPTGCSDSIYFARND